MEDYKRRSMSHSDSNDDPFSIFNIIHPLIKIKDSEMAPLVVVECELSRTYNES